MSAEICISSGLQYFNFFVLCTDERNIKSTAAQVIDENVFFLFRVQNSAVSNSGCCRFIDDSQDVETGDELVYDIVSSIEADPMNGAISEDSPFGKALLGKTAGADVVVDAPGGTIEYKIISVEK